MTSTSRWGRRISRYDAIIDRTVRTLAQLRSNREAAEQRDRCSWQPERGGWRCTADANPEHDHRYRMEELPDGRGREG